MLTDAGMQKKHYVINLNTTDCIVKDVSLLEPCQKETTFSHVLVFTCIWGVGSRTDVTEEIGCWQRCLFVCRKWTVRVKEGSVYE